MAERKPTTSRSKTSSKGSSTKASKSSSSKASPAKATTSLAAVKKKPPAPNLQERMEGVQGWMAEIEKKQERTSRAGGIAVLLAILAAGGALALGIINKQDAATTDDIDELTKKVNVLGASVEQQTEKQLKGINERLSTIEGQIASLNERQRQAEADITTLQNTAGQAAANPAQPGVKAPTP